MKRLEILAGSQLRVILGEGKQFAQRSGEEILGLALLLDPSGLNGLGAGLDDELKGLLLV